jgi:hypothetical protein
MADPNDKVISPPNDPKRTTLAATQRLQSKSCEARETVFPDSVRKRRAVRCVEWMSSSPHCCPRFEEESRGQAFGSCVSRNCLN